MIKKTINYTDYDGKERSEVFYFNLSKPELMEMERSPLIELRNLLQNIKDPDELNNESAYAERDNLMKKIGMVLRNLIIRSYGKKSSDGIRFIKRSPDGESLGEQFVETVAYEELYMELISDEGKLLAFIKGIIPAEYVEKAQAASDQTLKPVEN